MLHVGIRYQLYVKQKEDDKMYFDPGMGSLIIQTIIAGIAVVGGYFAFAKTKFKNRFSKDKSESDNTSASGEEKVDGARDDEL